MLSGNPNNAFYNMTMKILEVTRFQAPSPLVTVQYSKKKNVEEPV